MQIILSSISFCHIICFSSIKILNLYIYSCIRVFILLFLQLCSIYLATLHSLPNVIEIIINFNRHTLITRARALHTNKLCKDYSVDLLSQMHNNSSHWIIYSYCFRLTYLGKHYYRLKVIYWSISGKDEIIDEVNLISLEMIILLKVQIEI